MVPEENADRPPTDEPPLELMKARIDKGPILIGGCRDACEDPKNALRQFLRHLLVALPLDSPLTYRNFVDTTTLVDNGEALGTRWEAMWLAQQLEVRQREVEQWFQRYEDRVGGQVDEEALREMVERTMVFNRISSSLVEMEFGVPPIPESSVGTRWKVALARRGLEWLVRSIEDR